MTLGCPALGYQHHSWHCQDQAGQSHAAFSPELRTVARKPCVMEGWFSLVFSPMAQLLGWHARPGRRCLSAHPIRAAGEGALPSLLLISLQIKEE